MTDTTRVDLPTPTFASELALAAQCLRKAHSNTITVAETQVWVENAAGHTALARLLDRHLFRGAR
jgi:hypothetical protein